MSMFAPPNAKKRDKEREVLSLFNQAPVVRDAAKGRELAEAGMAHSSNKADPRWKELVRDCIFTMATIKPDGFTSDDVWEMVDQQLASPRYIGIPSPKDRQSGGTIFSSLNRDGIIVDTMTVRRSERPDAHRKKLTVWRRGRWSMQ